MLTTSARWSPALATDHGLAVQVDILDATGAVLAADIPFTDGVISVDRGSDVRRTCSLTVADPADFPVDATSRFSVCGHRLRIRRGLRYLDGSVELLTQGTFVITDVSGDIHRGPLAVSGDGLEILMKREILADAVSTVGYPGAGAFVEELLRDVDPNVAFVDRSTHGVETLSTATWDRGTEVWKVAQEVATSVAAELYCDTNGTFVLADVPTLATASPVWDVTTGEGGVMVSAEMSLSADGVVNHVVAEGENASDNTPPVSAEAKITDPTDPLRYGGPFGKVTKRVTSNLIKNTNQAQYVASAELEKGRAPNRTVSLSTVPNPALEAGDCLRVNYGPAARPELHLAQSFQLPLTVAGGSFDIETLSGRDDA